MAFDTLPDLIIASRNGSRAKVCVGGHAGNHNTAPHCLMCLNMVSDRERCSGPSAIDSRRSSSSFTLFSISSSVSLYAMHTRTSLLDSIHRHVLQAFALPRRVHRINRIELALSATFNSPHRNCCVKQLHLTHCVPYHTRHGSYQCGNHYLC